MKDSTRWSRTVSRLSRSRPGRPDDRRPEDAEAERRTDDVLRRLPADSWSVIGGLSARHGDPTHVVVGPGGVYVIASRQPRGCVRVKEGVPWLREGNDAQSDRPGVGVNRKVIEPARHLHREIEARSGHSVWVHPVVVLWSEFPQRIAETSQVAFVHGRTLAAWLQGRAPELDRAPRADVARALEQVAANHTLRASRLPRRSAA